jgi:hypothetical protein
MNGPIPAGDSLRVNLNNISIPEKVNNVPVLDRHVSIAVIAYNETTKEVVQAEKVMIMPSGSNSTH